MYIRFIIAFFTFISSISLPAQADSLSEIVTFAEKICANPVEGQITRTEIDARIKGDINGLAKALGISVGADGKLKHEDETYKGIPIDKLPEEIPTPAQCKSELAKILIKERKMLNFTNSEDYTDSSDWMGGGYDQIRWCNDVANSFISKRKIGPQHKVDIIKRWEESDKDWKGHVTYKYHCTVRIKWNSLVS